MACRLREVEQLQRGKSPQVPSEVGGAGGADLVGPVAARGARGPDLASSLSDGGGEYGGLDTSDTECSTNDPFLSR